MQIPNTIRFPCPSLAKTRRCAWFDNWQPNLTDKGFALVLEKNVSNNVSSLSSERVMK